MKNIGSIDFEFENIEWFDPEDKKLIDNCSPEQLSIVKNFKNWEDQNLEEEYIPIENLRKGVLVKSYKHGYRKIDLIGKNSMINNPNNLCNCMFKMQKTDKNELIEDLIITGGHSVLTQDLGKYKEENERLFGGTIMIDDKYLLLSAISKDFVKLENTNLYTYYHFCLENNKNDNERFGVWANGILTETPSKAQFNNHKFTLL